MMFIRQRFIGNIVVNADCETVHGVIFGEFMENGKKLVGRCVFSAETVTTADNHGRNFRVIESRTNIQIKRLTCRARLFRSVEDGNFFDGFGDSVEEMFHAERAIKMNADHADFFVVLVEIFRRLFRSLTSRTDSDNNSVRVRRAVVIKNVVFASGNFGNFRHIFFDNIGQRVIIIISRFAHLEIDIGICRRAFYDGVVGIERTAAEFFNRVIVNNFRKVGVVDSFNFLNFVRSSETVEEVYKRYSAFNRGKVSNRRQVHNFLNARLRKHRASRLTCRHNVLMVAENVQRGSRQSACGYMENARQKFTGDFVKIRNHQQETLRRRVGRSQRTCQK